MAESPKILYCRCAYAQVVPDDVKNAVLDGLCRSGASFETVSDLCEMSARKDPSLKDLFQSEDTRVAACYPRAVKWLLDSAGVKSSEQRPEPRVLNMRTESAESILKDLLDE